MSTSNTSFEHVIHNVQNRDRLIGDIHKGIDSLFSYLRHNHPVWTASTSIEMISKHLEHLFDNYNQMIERFNIGIISFISDYYRIIDQHLDQFNSKFLHNYSGHKCHYNPILPSTNEKFNIDELVSIFREHCVEMIKFKFHTNAVHVRRSRERTWMIYQKLANYIASENVYDLSNTLIHNAKDVVNGIHCAVERSQLDQTKVSTKDLLIFSDEGLQILNKLKHMFQQFDHIKLDFKPTEEILDYCECGNMMQILSGSSEMVCDHCGYIYELKGTVFSDEQFYSQDGIRYKHAGYEPSKHCRSWLERIQARETNTITDKQLSKIEACIRRDGITNKQRLSIEQLRRYLKDTGLTELNEHVALIKRLITGIAPPQLTYSETQDITNSFSKAVKAYNIIRPSNKSNMLFYPFLLWKLIEMHVSEFSKRKSLLSFIHLQGTQTLIQNDQIWSQICKITPSFYYRPTDRYEYID